MQASGCLKMHPGWSEIVILLTFTREQVCSSEGRWAAQGELVWTAQHSTQEPLVLRLRILACRSFGVWLLCPLWAQGTLPPLFPPRRGQHTDTKHHSAVQNDSYEGHWQNGTETRDSALEHLGFVKSLKYSHTWTCWKNRWMKKYNFGGLKILWDKLFICLRGGIYSSQHIYNVFHFLLQNAQPWLQLWDQHRESLPLLLLWGGLLWSGDWLPHRGS